MRIVVSGYRRCGTSAMMQALVAGMNNIVLAYCKDDWQLGNVPDKRGYVPSPTPLLEVGSSAYCNAKWLQSMPDNMLVKVFFDGLPTLPAGEYVIIFMERDLDEVKTSLGRAENHIINWALETKNHPPEKTKKRNAKVERTFCVYRDYNQDDIDHVLGIMEQRKDVTLLRVNYADLLDEPLKVLGSISEHIKLDVAKAATQIDKKYYRSKNDNRKVNSQK